MFWEVDGTAESVAAALSRFLVLLLLRLYPVLRSAAIADVEKRLNKFGGSRRIIINLIVIIFIVVTSIIVVVVVVVVTTIVLIVVAVIIIVAVVVILSSSSHRKNTTGSDLLSYSFNFPLFFSVSLSLSFIPFL